MRRGILVIATVFSIISLSFGQKVPKKLNKDWMNQKGSSLPIFSTYLGTSAGRVDMITNENLIFQPPIIGVAPEIRFNINPFKSAGFFIGLQYRKKDFSYRYDGIASNDTNSFKINGSWEHRMSNVGITVGFSIYSPISRRILSCTGFKISKVSTAHFYLDLGVVFAPSIVNSVYFAGNYDVLAKNSTEVLESVKNPTLAVMQTPVRRTNNLLMASIKPGFRFSNGDYAFRFGFTLDYQLNDSFGQLNDFTSEKFSTYLVGLHLGFELF